MRFSARVLTAPLAALAVLALAIVAFVGLLPGGGGPTPAAAGDGPSYNVQWGDINCDGTINGADMLAMMRAIAGLPATANSCTPAAPAAVEAGIPSLIPTDPIRAITVGSLDYAGIWADINCDRILDSYDALGELSFLGSLPFSIELGCANVGDDSTVISIGGVPNPPPVQAIAIDTDTSGNSANTLGTTDPCNTALVGDSFNVDVVVKGVPIFSDFAGGLGGMDFDFGFNPQVLKVTAVNDQEMLAANVSHNIVSYTETPPDTDGHFLVRAYDTSNNPEHGDGVLARITLQAIAGGDSALNLFAPPPSRGGSPQVLDNENYIYPIGENDGAIIHVGGSHAGCGSPFPTRSPSPTPVPTPTPTPGPGSDQCPSGSPVDIPDDDADGITDTMTLPDNGTITSMNMCLDISTVWPGDLTATLTHDDHTMTLFENLGGGHTGTCSGNGNGMYLYLTDDEGAITESLEEACENGHDLIGTFPPEETFVTFSGVFNGDTTSGDWDLHIADNHADGFTAQLLGWQLYFNQ